MPSIAAPLPQSGSIQQCLAQLGVNIALLGTVKSSSDTANRAALEEALAGPFRQLVDSVKKIIFGDTGVVNELSSIVNEFIPTSMDALLQQMKESPTRLIGGIINASENLVSQLYQYGSSEVGQVLDSLKKLFQSCLFFSPESILGIGYQALVYGLPSVVLQKESLYMLRKMVREVNSEVQKGNIPKQINPSNPFSEAIEELCRAKKDFKIVQDDLILKTTFNRDACGSGTTHIFNARDTLIEGKNSEEFLKDFAANQFGIADTDITDFANRRWLPPVSVGLNKEGIIALLRPISQTNNNIKTLQDNLAGLIDKLQLNVKFENILVLFVQFIQNEIARYQNALLAATGDPNGNIQQWENNRAMLVSQLDFVKSNPNPSNSKITSLQAEIIALDEKINLEKEKVATQSPESFNPGTLINSLSVQMEVAIGLTILGTIANGICSAISKFENLWSKVVSLNANSWVKKFNDILEEFNPANCPEFSGNKLLCSTGKYLDTINDRLTLKSNDDRKVINYGNSLLKDINAQLLYLDCMERKLTNGSKEIKNILLASGSSALLASFILNGVSMQSVLEMLGLDFDLWFLKSTQSNLYDSILASLVCIMQSCDNPGMTRYVNQLMTKINADKKSEDTRSIDYRHMAKESQFNDTFSTNSRIKTFMDILSSISGLGFSLCIPGSTTNDPNKTKENIKQIKQGNKFEQILCTGYISPLPQSVILGNNLERVKRVYK